MAVALLLASALPLPTSAGTLGACVDGPPGSASQVCAGVGGIPAAFERSLDANQQCLLEVAGRVTCGSGPGDMHEFRKGIQDIRLHRSDVCARTVEQNVVCHSLRTTTDLSAFAHNGGDAVALDFDGRAACVVLRSGNVECRGSLMARTLAMEAPDHAGGDAVGVAVRFDRVCFVLRTGNVLCEGLPNPYGAAEDYLGGDAAAVSLGDRVTCVLLRTGNVPCYGDDRGSGILAGYWGGDAVAIDSSEDGACALLATGNVDCWGGWGSWERADYAGGDAISLHQSDYDGYFCVVTLARDLACLWGGNGPADEARTGIGASARVLGPSVHVCRSLSGDECI